jgi:hypothetical protein
MEGKKHKPETIELFKKLSSGENNPNYNKHNKIHSEEFKQRMRDNNPIKFKKTSPKGSTLSLSPEEIDRRKQHIKKVNERGFENKGGRTKFYDVDGVKLQGRYELFFYLSNNRKHTKCNQRFKTPFGTYQPDFELNGVYFEIKSVYTFKTCIQGKQIKKILWFRNNISRIRIIILKESEVNDYLKTVSTKIAVIN